MEDIVKIVTSLEESGLLIKGGGKQLKLNQRSKKVDFLVDFLGASLVGGLLSGKSTNLKSTNQWERIG